jgi:NAD(P)-dependent dehydrogenase (short-subunit alcohol dehydrogenase family)
VKNISAYAATKGAIDTIVKHFAAALGPKGIRVNAVAPGVVMVEDQWLIGAGLQSGERIVVDGFQRVRAGITVTPVPSRAKPGQPESAPSRAANNQETSQAQRPGVHTSQAAKELSDAALSGASVQ